MTKPNLQSFDSADGTIKFVKILGIVIAFGLLFKNIAFAQQEPGAVLKVPWAMDVQASSIAISTKKATELRWYLISVGSPMKSAVEVIVDGVGSNNPVNFSGSALFWSKQIELKRYSGTESLSGCVFRTKNATQSGAKKPLIPIQRSQPFRSRPCQLFRFKKATLTDKKPTTWTG